MAFKRKKVIVPVFHSGECPCNDLHLIMGTMQYVPKAGAMTGPYKTSAAKVRCAPPPKPLVIVLHLLTGFRVTLGLKP